MHLCSGTNVPSTDTDVRTCALELTCFAYDVLLLFILWPVETFETTEMAALVHTTAKNNPIEYMNWHATS